ncbi:unnamed protein product [Urochloa decumbens]|uniref:F-box protein AT5G49610-like beta-propeller domain-containing protein n=1 Tax=Urochloa decumbens TaxID=240449 RepID=A0ABC9G3B3_9POAL
MASQGRRILPGLEGTDPDRPPPPLTSDLHVEIFLRVGSPADLARASAACISFRRLISDPGFLRRYRSIHPPLHLGFLSYAEEGFQPVEAPHPNAAVARAVARAADFSFGFVPFPIKRCRCRQAWHLRDARDGRVLLECRSITIVDGEECLDLVVCDPVFRRYLMLPPITDELLASVELQNQHMCYSSSSFIPSGDMEETSFSVICWVFSGTKLVVFFFSSSSGHWTVGTSTSWNDLGFQEEVDSLSSCQCVHGCFYWKVNYINKLLKLDMNTMELSAHDLPPDHEDEDIVIAESGEGKVAMFSQVGYDTSVKYYNLLQNSSEKSHEWHMRSTIRLPDQYTSECYINGPAEGYIFLAGTPKDEDATHPAFFSLEIKSLKIEGVSGRTSDFQCDVPYFGFPPSMSSRRIQ